MRPYPRNATLHDAILALEEAQKRYESEFSPYLHRAVLVYDKNRKIVGKVSQLDILMALEPSYKIVDLEKFVALWLQPGLRAVIC